MIFAYLRIWTFRRTMRSVVDLILATLYLVILMCEYIFHNTYKIAVSITLHLFSFEVCVCLFLQCVKLRANTIEKQLTGKDLANLSMDDLKAKLLVLRKEYFQLRVQKTEGGRTPATTNRLSDVQKDIARVLTFIRKLQIKAVEEKYKDSEFKPTMLRKHTTRAFRLALTPEQKNKKVFKVAKRLHSYPKIKFALK